MHLRELAIGCYCLPVIRGHRLLLIVIVLAILVGAITAVMTTLLNGWGNPIRRNLPPPRVLQGKQIKWRTLLVRRFVQLGKLKMGEPDGAAGSLLVANFDADPDDEILRIHADPKAKSELFDLDGTQREVPVNDKALLFKAVAWDWDRDGIAELVPDPTYYFSFLVHTSIHAAGPGQKVSESAELPVFDLSGKIVDTLPFAHLGGTANTADIDGDGFSELVLDLPDNKGFAAYGLRGAEVWKQQGNPWFSFICPGDYDGDGRDELIYIKDQKEMLAAPGRQPKDICALCQMPVIASIDLDGDGVDEAFNEIDGTKNVESGTTLAFQPKIGMLVGGGDVACGDFDGDGDRELVVGGGINSKLYIYDNTGKRFYYEEMGDIVFHVACAHAGGKDYLVVQLGERILIYP